MKLEVEQKRLDEEKWLKSEQAGRDVCGEFEYCSFCDKAHAHPCANALSLAKKPAKKACAMKKKEKVEEKKTCKKAEKKVAKKETKKATKSK